MDIPEYFTALSDTIGPVAALIVVGLLWDRWRLVKRIDQLTDQGAEREREATKVIALNVELQRRLEQLVERVLASLQGNAR